MVITAGKWSFDTTKTQERYKALEEYYKLQGLNAEDFRCRFFAECAVSQKPGTIKQYSGGTIGLSPFYDVSYAGIPIRVLVIGKEASHEPEALYGTAANFAVRSRQIHDTIFSTRRTNHIKGTLLTLQYIFGVQSEYVYASYALGNALRCAFQRAAIAQNTSNLPDTRTMRANCFQYLAKEIRILEPTLVITQGAWALNHKAPLIETLAAAFGVEPETIMTNEVNGKYGLYAFPTFMYLTGHHPARLELWKKNLAPDSLWPMLGYLKTTGYLPAIAPEDADQYEAVVKPYIDSMTANSPRTP